MDSYDYMKSLLPVPSHSVSLTPMSGGGSTNTTQFPEEEENVFGVFDFSKNVVKNISESSISIKEFNIGIFWSEIIIFLFVV